MRPAHLVSTGIAAVAAVFLGTVLWAIYFREMPAGARGVRPPARVVPVSEERCLDCHRETRGFSPYHDPAVLGCARCHLGDAGDPTKEGGHRGMVSVPGNLSTASETCGGPGCHAAIVGRVRGSLMATARGIVAVDRYVFGEHPTPDGTDGMADLGGSAADSHLRQLCYSCHLGYEKTEPGPVTETSRGGGCVACHVRYEGPRDGTAHPALTVQVTDDHCFGCHSRSGRISLNYQGWHETLLDAAAAVRADSAHRVLADGRVLVRRPADVHHAAGLACIDCHTAGETMGDGRVYGHQEDATVVECTTCHRNEPPATVGWDEVGPEDRATVMARSGAAFPERRYVVAGERRDVLTNVFLSAHGEAVFEGKLTRLRHSLAPPAEACARPGHERLSCQSCHTAWVPQCTGCHTQRDEAGEWREFASDYRSGPPTLGVRKAGEDERIEPFAPGMVMTLNAKPSVLDGGAAALAAAGAFHRLYAPAVPHTTSTAGRTCESCHLDPLALGFGRGTLRLEGRRPATWVFTPEYAALRDGLPADAWIPFLETRADRGATRTDARPFDRAEQQRILRVGACLTCHPGTERRIYDDFPAVLLRLADECRVPAVGDADGSSNPRSDR